MSTHENLDRLRGRLLRSGEPGHNSCIDGLRTATEEIKRLDEENEALASRLASEKTRLESIRGYIERELTTLQEPAYQEAVGATFALALIERLSEVGQLAADPLAGGVKSTTRKRPDAIVALGLATIGEIEELLGGYMIAPRPEEIKKRLKGLRNTLTSLGDDLQEACGLLEQSPPPLDYKTNIDGAVFYYGTDNVLYIVDPAKPLPGDYEPPPDALSYAFEEAEDGRIGAPGASQSRRSYSGASFDVSPEAFAEAVGDPDKERGFYPKWKVERLKDPAGKHKACSLIVLDLDHDKLALPAATEYAIQARKAGYVRLAEDIEGEVDEREGGLPHSLQAEEPPATNAPPRRFEFGKISPLPPTFEGDSIDLENLRSLAEETVARAFELPPEALQGKGLHADEEQPEADILRGNLTALAARLSEIVGEDSGLQAIQEVTTPDEAPDATNEARAEKLRLGALELYGYLSTVVAASSIDHIPGSILDELEDDIKTGTPAGDEGAAWEIDNLERVNILRGVFEVYAHKPAPLGVIGFTDGSRRIAKGQEYVATVSSFIDQVRDLPADSPVRLRVIPAREALAALSCLVEGLAEDYRHAQIRERRYEERLEAVAVWIWRRLDKAIASVPSDMPTVLRFLLRLATGTQELQTKPGREEIVAAIEFSVDTGQEDESREPEVKHTHNVFCYPWQQALRDVRRVVGRFRLDTLEAARDFGDAVVSPATVTALNTFTAQVFKIVDEGLGDAPSETTVRLVNEDIGYPKRKEATPVPEVRGEPTAKGVDLGNILSTIERLQALVEGENMPAGYGLDGARTDFATLRNFARYVAPSLRAEGRDPGTGKPLEIVDRLYRDIWTGDACKTVYASLADLRAIREYVQKSLRAAEMDIEGGAFPRSGYPAEPDEVARMRDEVAGVKAALESLRNDGEANGRRAEELRGRLVLLTGAHARKVRELETEIALKDAGLLMALAIVKRLYTCVDAHTQMFAAYTRAITDLQTGEILKHREGYQGLNPLTCATKLLGEIKALSESSRKAGRDEMSLADENTPRYALEILRGGQTVQEATGE
jgi:hypothetical protein